MNDRDRGEIFYHQQLFEEGEKKEKKKEKEEKTELTGLEHPHHSQSRQELPSTLTTTPSGATRCMVNQPMFEEIREVFGGLPTSGMKTDFRVNLKKAQKAGGTNIIACNQEVTWQVRFSFGLVQLFVRFQVCFLFLRGCFLKKKLKFRDFLKTA